MNEQVKGRRIIKTAQAEFGEYSWDPAIKDMSLLKLSYDHKSAQGSYMIRMQPGAETEFHVHKRREEYLIIEGDLIEPDGTVLGPGDVVIFEAGTKHNSKTENGCLIFAVEYSWSEQAGVENS